MSKDITNYGKSIRDKILNVSRANNLLFQTLVTQYFQERLMYRLSISRYRDNFFLKGGALMYAYEKYAARPTLDIDFLGANISNDEENIISIFREICSLVCEEDGVSYEVDSIKAKRITEFKDYHGFRLSLNVSLDTVRQQMTMDIGFGDIVTPRPINLEYPVIIDSLPHPTLLAYSIETVMAEKLHAIIELADRSSRMKDYYDLFQLLSNHSYDPDILQEAITATFNNRHTPYHDTMVFQPDYYYNSRLEVQWKAFIKRMKLELELKTVMDRIRINMIPYWIMYGFPKSVDYQNENWDMYYSDTPDEFIEAIRNANSRNEFQFFTLILYKILNEMAASNECLLHENDNEDGFYILRCGTSDFLIGTARNNIEPRPVTTEYSGIFSFLKQDLFPFIHRHISIWDWLRERDYRGIRYDRNYDYT